MASEAKKNSMRLIAALAPSVALAHGNAAIAAEESPSANPAKRGKVQLPEGVTEEMLAPPPVPQFMLRKSCRTLTTEEMIRQAREAEGAAQPRRARRPKSSDSVHSSTSAYLDAGH